jgi:hypothetical protein
VDSARLFALGFGTVYLLVTIWGFIDGNDVLGLIPVNAADNVLHIALSALGILAGLISRGDRDDHRAAGITGDDRYRRDAETTSEARDRVAR